MKITSRKPERESGLISTAYAWTVWISRNPEQVMRIGITGSTMIFQKMALSEPVASSISNPPGTSLLWVASKTANVLSAHEKGLHLARKNECSALVLYFCYLFFSALAALGAGSNNRSALVERRNECFPSHATSRPGQGGVQVQTADQLYFMKRKNEYSSLKLSMQATLGAQA